MVFLEINKHTPSLNAIRFDFIPGKLGKSKILPFPIHQLNVTQPFDIIHSDVWAVTPIICHANYKYCVSFINDYSLFTWSIFFARKMKFFPLLNFKFFDAYVQTQYLLLYYD